MGLLMESVGLFGMSEFGGRWSVVGGRAYCTVRPRLLILLVFGLLVLGFVSGVGVSDEVLEKFGSGEKTVRVLMKMNGDGEINKGFRIFSTKQASIEDVIGKGQINKKVSDYVSAYISKAELDELLLSGVVDSISVEQVYHTMLQDSVEIMNATSAWNLEKLGLNLTGTGQSVCIIDTGINYSHADFGGCNSSEFLAGTCEKVIGGWDFCGNDGNCSIEDNDPMDIAGHGTHVSGIVAANGGIDGIGKGANIVMMKAANVSGVFLTSDIVDAIDRCVANASVFNISVISMSLGGGQFTGYCDGYDENTLAMANSINNAVANNISVVVATGNNEWNDSISSPACIQNATRVAATDKSDNIAIAYSNRNSITKLFATGSNINSTIISGGYSGNTWSGTSMATPMVAGAIAIINQYLNLNNQTKTPFEIETTLYDTGLQFNESDNNFSRIDIYSALLSLDVDAPNVTLVFPNDTHVSVVENQTFVCNATDWQLANVTFRIWNSSGLYHNESRNLSGTSNETSFDLTGIPVGSYEWNCFVYDDEGNLGNASNFSLIIGTIEVSLNSPLNGSYTNDNLTSFNCTSASDSNNELSNVTFRIWNSSDVLMKNETRDINGTRNTTIFNWTFEYEDDYLWDCVALNNNSNEDSGGNFSVGFDATVPNLTLTSLPSNATSDLVSKSFGFNVSDINLANCSLIINDTISLNDSSINQSEGQTFNETFTPGTYVWNINCSDFAGNVNSSDENSFVITAELVEDEGNNGGGGGGGGATTASSVADVVLNESAVYDVGSSEVSKGYSKSLKKGERVNFSLFDFEGGRHLLTVDEIGRAHV